MREKPKSTVTIVDIARIAGVSHSTVSRCLNDSPQIPERTKARIREIAQSLNFQFNASARALSSSKTGTAAILYPVMYDDPRNLQYTKLLLHDLQESLSSRGYDSLMTSQRDRSTGQSNLTRLVACRKIDGLIMINESPSPDETRLLNEAGLPAVLVDAPPESAEFDVFGTDNVEGGRMATDCLIERGRCSAPLTVTMASGGASFSGRTAGFMTCLANRRIPTEGRVIELPQGSVFEAGFEWAKANIEMLVDGRVDGIFAQADLLALGIISALREAHVDVPGKVRIVGFDDTAIAGYFQPRLTTLHQPREAIAHSAAMRLSQLLEAKAPLSRVVDLIPPRLVIRESC